MENTTIHHGTLELTTTQCLQQKCIIIIIIIIIHQTLSFCPFVLFTSGQNSDVSNNFAKEKEFEQAG